MLESNCNDNSIFIACICFIVCGGFVCFFIVTDTIYTEHERLEFSNTRRWWRRRQSLGHRYKGRNREWRALRYGLCSFSFEIFNRCFRNTELTNFQKSWKISFIEVRFLNLTRCHSCWTVNWHLDISGIAAYPPVQQCLAYILSQSNVKTQCSVSCRMTLACVSIKQWVCTISRWKSCFFFFFKLFPAEVLTVLRD